MKKEESMGKIDKVSRTVYKHGAPLFLMVTGFLVIAVGLIAYGAILGRAEILEFGEGGSQVLAIFSLFWFMVWGVWFLYKGVETAKKFGSSPES